MVQSFKNKERPAGAWRCLPSLAARIHPHPMRSPSLRSLVGVGLAAPDPRACRGGEVPTAASVVMLVKFAGEASRALVCSEQPVYAGTWVCGRTHVVGMCWERSTGIIWTFMREKMCTHLCVLKCICFLEAYLERCFICNRQFSKCNPEQGICSENTHTGKGFGTKHKAIIEVCMPKCTVNQTYGEVYCLVSLKSLVDHFSFHKNKMMLLSNY